MKIRAIRLREVGRFTEPVALEGLTGGLDVLAGPNEFGKSTILRAVRAALFEQHRSKHRKLEVLRPYGGGAPLIEIDFDAAGGEWRIRKQFLSSPGAELRDLRTGGVTARGADAEVRLAELLGGTGHHALLCVEQGTPLSAMAPIETGGATFMAAIESEVENVADGSAARFVAERIRSELATLLTSHSSPRPTGALKAALDERDSLASQLEEARARTARAQSRLDELEQLRATLTALADEAATSARGEADAAARRAFDEAREASQKSKTAAEAVKACERQLEAAENVLKALDDRLSHLADREAAATQAEPQLAQCVAHAATCAERTNEARKAHDAAKAVLTGLERDRQALVHAQRLEELTARLDAALAADAERVEILALLNDNGAEDKVVDAARREMAAIARIEARLTAAAPRIQLQYAPGADGSIIVDGRPLADGEVLHPTRPVTLEIPGVGKLTIAPGQSDDVAREEAEVATHRRNLSDLLQRCQAASLDDAERLLAERRDAEARLSDATARLKAAAREGLASLQRAHAQLSAIVATAGVLPTPEELEAQAGEAAEALHVAEAELADAVAADRVAREDLATLRARSAGYADDIARLAAQLGAPEVREATRAQKAAAVEAASAALNAAIREAGAWRDKAPDDDRLAQLKHNAETAEAARQKAQRDLETLRQREAGLLGELRTDQSDDVATRQDELRDLHARAEERCRVLQQDAAALQLLAQELDAAATRTKDRFVLPVVARLAPYLQLMLPQSKLVLGEDLAPAALERGNAREDFARLSGGTQEQLGLLVRLAFARLLAETGSPAPLIIDDAVVNTDDERLARLFQTLRHAAQSHQVLVLTCRQRDFEALGGHRIALGDWRDVRAAA